MTKINVFSGFLGAGKTTLIKKLIAEAFRGEKLVLIENEFGEIGIDGGFLQDAGIEIREMNSGCICCSLVGDFGRALNQVVEQFHPDRILIEPSGVGKLSDVARAVLRSGAPDLVLAGTVTVVDATRCKMYMKNFGEFFNDQVQTAGTIILSRTANIAPERLEECVTLLREKNAAAVIITTDWEQLSGKQILEALERQDTLANELKRLQAESADGDEEEEHHHHHHDDDDDDEEECHHHHGGAEGEEHHHHHHHADEVFTSWGVETARKYTKEQVGAILDKLQDNAVCGTVLRAKGIVDAVDGWIHFDYVPGESDVRSGSAAVSGRICVIGAKLDEDRLAELFGIGR